MQNRGFNIMNRHLIMHRTLLLFLALSLLSACSSRQGNKDADTPKPALAPNSAELQGVVIASSDKVKHIEYNLRILSVDRLGPSTRPLAAGDTLPVITSAMYLTNHGLSVSKGDTLSGIFSQTLVPADSNGVTTPESRWTIIDIH